MIRTYITKSKAGHYWVTIRNDRLFIRRCGYIENLSQARKLAKQAKDELQFSHQPKEEPMQPTPETIREILAAAKSGFVSINFTKANGEARQLTTNPKQVGIVLGTGKPCKDPAVFRIMDVKLNQWRSFRAERVTSMRANGVTTVFDQEVQ